MQSGVKIHSDLSVPVDAYFRLFYFLMSITVVGFIFGYVVFLPLAVLGRFSDMLKKHADWVMCGGVGILMRLQVWLKSDIELRLPPIGQGVLLVSNHRSHLDVFLLLSQVQGIRVLAKGSLFKIPLLGVMMWALRQIPVQRGQVSAFIKAMEEVSARLQRGERVYVFPEMTRCALGQHGVLPFSVAPFRAALRSQRPVLPIVIEATDTYWPRGLLAVLRSSQTVRVRSLKMLYPDQFENAEQLRDAAALQIKEALA